MSTSTVDLSGQDGFLPASYDANGNPISSPSLSDNTSGAPSSGGGSGSVVDSGDNTSLAGLTGIFSAVGSAFSSAYRSVNPTVQTRSPNTLVYNPATGGYVTAGGVSGAATTSALMPIALLIGAVLIIYLVARK